MFVILDFGHAGGLPLVEAKALDVLVACEGRRYASPVFASVGAVFWDSGFGDSVQGVGVGGYDTVPAMSLRII